MTFLTISELCFMVLLPLMVMSVVLLLWRIRIYPFIDHSLFLNAKEALINSFVLITNHQCCVGKFWLYLSLMAWLWLVALKSQGLFFEWVDFYFLMLILSLMIFDSKYCLLPDPAVYSLLWGGVVLSLFELSQVSLASAISGVIYAYSVMFLIYLLGLLRYRQEAIGRGDLKFSAAVGAWIGGENILLFLFLAALIGIFLGVLKGLKDFFKVNEGIPFGPSLGFSGIILYFITRLTVSF